MNAQSLGTRLVVVHVYVKVLGSGAKFEDCNIYGILFRGRARVTVYKAGRKCKRPVYHVVLPS